MVPKFLSRCGLLPSGLATFLPLLAATLLMPALRAQAPIALPGNVTTVAGGGAASTGTASTPVACATGSPYKSYSTYGDGCPGPQTNFSTDLRGGIASDGQGNIYIMDTTAAELRKYDPKSTLVTRVSGKGTNCTAANGLLDTSGNGCPSQQTSYPSAPRGVGTDPYGNVFIAGYQNYMVEVVCMAASPICPAGVRSVGSQYRIAGCVATSGGTGAATPPVATATTAGTEGDGSFASPFSNSVAEATAGIAGTSGSGTCGTTAATQTVGMVNGARGVAADKYGNVYIAETGNTNIGLRYRLVLGPQTSTYFTGNNPLYAFLGNYSAYAGKVHVGYIYTIAGGFTSPASGAVCATGSAFTSTDAYGDGCPFFYSNMNGAVQGVAVDNYGNAIFSDTVHSLLRVLYSGGASSAANPMYAAIVANSPSVTPTAGNIYLLAGGNTAATSTFASTTPTLGSAVLLSNGIQRLNIGPGGNIYLGDTGATQALFYDVSTGYIRQLFKNGTACAAHVTGSSNGDGCPSPAGFTVSTANAFGIAPDPLGNLYLADQANGLIRKVEAESLIPTVVGSTTAASAPLTQTLQFHGPKGTANITVAALNAPADIVVGTVTCPAANADTTMDCTVPVTFAPAQPGTRTANLAVQALNASGTVLGSAVVPVSGTGQGTALVTDTATPNVASSNGLTPVTAAVGGAGNIYTVDTGSGQVIKANVSAGSSTPIGTAPASPLQTAVDTTGNVYITSSGSASYTQFVQNLDGTYTANTITNLAITLPQGIAVDATGNQYIADKSTGKLFEIAVGSNFANAQPPVVLGSGYANPVGVALDGLGNIFVADQGLPGVYKITSVNGVPTQTLYAAASGATVTLSATPSAIAADAAGNVYVQDAASKAILAIPVSQAGPTSISVLTGLTVPSGVAVDGNGVVYSVDSGAPALRQVKRNALAFDFGTSTSLVFSGVITNAGNINASGYQATGLDTSDFPVTSVSPTNCFNATSITPGYACSVTSQFSPGSGTGTVTSTVAYAPAASTTGNLVFSGTKTGAAVTTTTTISNQTPASPVYSVSGTEVTFTVSVMASDSSTQNGAVTVSVDSGTPVAYTLTGGTVSVPLSGLAAGSHTIVAAYATQGGVTGSTSTTVNFTVAQAATTVNWTPGATTQQYSAAVGTGVLNAQAVQSGTSTAVAGYYLYTATTGGVSKTVYAASYLGIGTYSLAVTFVPVDTTDFAQSTATVPTYTVTKATTTAGLGATQMLVAADGTGNYTSIQAAINTIGATAGGNVYVKPGTYTGDVTVVQPNVSLRGLGGDPTAVVITHSGGAFGGSGVYQYAGEFNTSQANGAQLPTGSSLFNGDEGSATLVVAKGVNTAVSTATLIPNGFYGENFTLLNTYNTDTTTTTTTYLPASNSGTCTANQGPARTYNDLYNNSLECASQALAIWTTADLQVMNNVYTGSLQDTIYAGSQGAGSNGYVPARQYWFRGKVQGQVDYIFGDAAAVFDYSSIYTLPKLGFTSSTQTIEAQNKMTQTGSANDYLSGYVMNSNVFTSYTTGMTSLEFGRPYGPYSTWIMLNSYVDQVAPAGYIEFSSGTTNLPSSTYSEFNDLLYTDPATGSADLNGVIYTGMGGNTGTGVTGTREAVSQNPGTPQAANTPKTSLTAAQATLYYPTKFLSATVAAALSPVANFIPTTALATNVNAFATGGTATSIVGGSSVTILMRPQTPGLGAVTNGTYTVPTGTYTLTDTFNGTATTLASGSLDASGEAYYTTSSLNAGSHSLAWTYGGDANFSGSTASAYTLTVTGTATTTTLQTTSPITYGQTASVLATVASTAGTPNGSVVLTIDGTTTQTQTLAGGQTTFNVAGLTAGTHSFTATYSGGMMFTGSTTVAATSLTVNQAVLTVTASCANRQFHTADNCSSAVTGYQYSDNAGTVFVTAPTATTNATLNSPAGTYTATPANTALTASAATNYTVNPVSTTYTITGSGNAAQAILFYPLPNFVHGASYQLTARTTSGLPVTYTITAGTGIATISGSTLTVNGTGTVTVQATATDPAGDYAAATSVSRSFIAQ